MLVVALNTSRKLLPVDITIGPVATWRGLDNPLSVMTITDRDGLPDSAPLLCLSSFRFIRAASLSGSESSTTSSEVDPIRLEMDFTDAMVLLRGVREKCEARIDGFRFLEMNNWSIIKRLDVFLEVFKLDCDG